jgi:acetyl-CoA acetyltransferase
VGESTIYRAGGSPESEFVLALRAILAACADAGIDPTEIQGFTSYCDDRNTAHRLANALGLPELRFANMQWGGGGGGSMASVANAVRAVAADVADVVVAFRSLAQGQFGRFGHGVDPDASGVSDELAYLQPYGMFSAAQMYAMRFQRWMRRHGGAGMEAQRAVALASYYHAQNNPRAIMHGRPLTAEMYDASRIIVEPWRLYDCCQENDAAAAAVIVRADRAADCAKRPVFLLAAAEGSSPRYSAAVDNGTLYDSANFTTVAPRLWQQAGIGPRDVDVVQCYENFTGCVVMALVEHGICAGPEVDEVLRFDDLIAPSGRTPLNTSGGNLAEGYIHGLGLAVEGVRQLRAESCNQVPDARVALVIGGPLTTVPSTMLLTSEPA